MKRLFGLVIIMLMLCGCTRTAKITPITKGISFVCEATYYNEYYECKCIAQKNGDTSIEFTLPADIEGLKFVFSKNGTLVKFREIEYVGEKTVFENTIAALIYEVLAKETGTVYLKNEVFYVEGVNKDFEYRLELGETGLPLKITTSPDVAQVTFKKVKIL